MASGDLSDDALKALVRHYTPVNEEHSTPLQRQTLSALRELWSHRLCVHRVPRRFCTSVHDEQDTLDPAPPTA